MRFFPFLLFLLLLLTGVGYALWHVWCVLPFGKLAKGLTVVVLAILLFSLFFFLGGRLDRMPLAWATPIYEVTTSAPIVLLYTVMLFLLLDVLRLFRVIPHAWLHNNGWTAIGIVLLLAGIFVCGNLRYRHKYRKELVLTTTKPLQQDLKIVMLSDLHLGYHNRLKEWKRWVELLNEEQADAILIAGDICDISVRPLNEEDMAAEFRRLNAPVYACLGNHEYYSWVPAVGQFYEKAGIHLLRDSSAMIGSHVCVIGRDDATNRERKSLQALTDSVVGDSIYTLLLDHQPFHLDEAETCGIDFQLSGHTHHGQVWPISWITDAIYEIAYGEGQRGNTRYYVTSGMGIWGGKYRIGTRSEYVVATLKRQ